VLLVGPVNENHGIITHHPFMMMLLLLLMIIVTSGGGGGGSTQSLLRDWIQGVHQWWYESSSD